MAAIPPLLIRIKALDKTKKAFAGITTSFKSVSAGVLNMRSALALTAGAAGVGLLVRSSLNATDQLAKTAAKIGTTTEALSALQYAGKLTGVETQTMNMALQRFTRRTAEAAMGTGEAKGAIRELGINARELVQMPLDERMLVLADAFQGVTNESDRLRLAFKLFDSEGAALVNTLGQGREGLSEMLGEARALGVVMSSGAAKGVEDANDALFRMQSLFGGVVKQVVAAMAPAIAALADLMTQKVLSSFDDTEEGVQGFAKALAVDMIDGIIKAVKGFQSLINGLIATANELLIVKSRLTGLFTPDDQKSAEQLAVRITDISDKIKFQQNLLENGNNRQKRNAKKRLEDLNAEKTALRQLLMEALKAGKVDLIQGSNFGAGLVNILEGVKEQIGSTVESMGELDNATGTTTPSAFEAFSTSLNAARSQIYDFDADAQKAALSFEGAFTDSFMSAVTGAKNFGDAMKGLAKTVVDSLLKMFIQYQITKPLFDALTGGGGSGGGLLGSIGKALGFRANGGPVTGGQPYVVGERGPELFVPSSGGTVVPNNALGGGGVTVVQNINVTTGVQQTVRAEIANLLPQISNAAKSAVADARLRGGGFSKAMVGA